MSEQTFDGTFAATTKAADAPDIESGLYDGRFEGVSVKRIEGGAFGDGDRFVWLFTLLDDEGAVMYEEREDHDSYGDPIEVDGLSSMSVNVKSKTTPKAVRYLKALMTADEFAEFEAGNGVPQKELVGRIVQVDIAIRDNGWPSVNNVIPKRQVRKARSRAAAQDAD